MTGPAGEPRTIDERQRAEGGVSPAVKRSFDANPLHRYLGIELEAQQDGYCRIVLTPNEHTPGGVAGSVHGGILATMVDVATLGAVASAVGPREQMNGTAELNISYLRPALSKRVVAEGRLLKKGRTLAVVDVDISDGQGRLFAKGRVQYALRSKA